MRKPGLNQLYDWIVNPGSALEGLGPRRAVMHCRRHGPRWFTLAEIRDDVILARGLPAGDLHSGYDIAVSCDVCPSGVDERVLDLAKLRAALAAPHRGPLKLDIDAVSRAPRDSH